MMKRIAIGLLSGMLFFTACRGATPLSQPIADSVSINSTSSPTSIVTRISIPSSTPTASITPLPTIPTFTPTFDVSTIVTVTPAPKAECSEEHPNLLPSFPIRTNENYFLENSAEILQYINEGGTLKKAAGRLEITAPSYSPPIIEDVTGDKIPELIFVDYAGEPKLHVFSCDNGQYQDILQEIKDDLTGYSTAIHAAVNDLNQNGIPDILLRTSCSRGLFCTSLFILEWNGSEFINLLVPRELFEGSTERKIQDINNDRILEVIIKEDVNGDYAYFMGFPWRISTHIYMWNGSHYALQDIQYTAPEYRFQALQDADRFVLLQDFDSALELYNMTISGSGKNLLPYSRELSEHMEWLLWNPLSLGVATQPSPDTAEYPRLAAYAYYRIMLIHLVQNHESEATTTYTTLQQEFGNDPYARPYVEMASAFWEAYQSTHKMYDGCAEAIQYAVEHPEILSPLGSDYHGAQSHIYVPDDVCPFR